MKRALLSAWLADLRANPNLQGRGWLLTDEGTYCCLGRLCLLLPTHNIPEQDGWQHNDRLYAFETVKALNIPYEFLDECIERNDGRSGDQRGTHYAGLAQTFPQIADWIEQTLIPEDEA